MRPLPAPFLSPCSPCIAGDRDSFRLAPCCAQDGAKPAAQKSQDTVQLSSQLEAWMADYATEYAKAKKPSAELQVKINGLIGKNITVSGLLRSADGPLVVSVGAAGSTSRVDYILQVDFPKKYRGEEEVGVQCTGVISFIDPAKKIVLLDHGSAIWLGTN